MSSLTSHDPSMFSAETAPTGSGPIPLEALIKNVAKAPKDNMYGVGSSKDDVPLFELLFPPVIFKSGQEVGAGTKQMTIDGVGRSGMGQYWKYRIDLLLNKHDDGRGRVLWIRSEPRTEAPTYFKMSYGRTQWQRQVIQGLLENAEALPEPFVVHVSEENNNGVVSCWFYGFHREGEDDGKLLFRMVRVMPMEKGDQSLSAKSKGTDASKSAVGTQGSGSTVVTTPSHTTSVNADVQEWGTPTASTSTETAGATNRRHTVFRRREGVSGPSQASGVDEPSASSPTPGTLSAITVRSQTDAGARTSNVTCKNSPSWASVATNSKPDGGSSR